MVQTCFIKGCESRADRNNRISFFYFPSDKSEHQQWKDSIFRLNKQSCDSVSKYSRICELHFHDSDIKRSNCRCTLKKGSEPSIFHNGESRRNNESVQQIDTSKEFTDVEYLDEVLEENSMDVEYFGPTQSGLTQSNVTSIDLNNRIIDGTMLVEPVETYKSMRSVEQWPTENYSVDGTVKCQNCGYGNSMVTTSYLPEPCRNLAYSCTSTPSISVHHSSGVSSSHASPKTPMAHHKKSCSANLSLQGDKNELINLPARGTKRRLCYPGDVKENEDLTPRSSKKFIRSLKTTVTKQRIKINTLQKRKRRALKRISTLKDLVRDLKKKNLVSDNAWESLKLQDESLMHKIKLGKVNNRFPADVRSFALTLHFYSPRAYRYVRNSFAKKLPTPRTIRKWYESVDADPGITEEALNALTIRIEESKNKGIDLRFCMSIDEMSIRKQIEYSNSKKKYYGYVDFGGVDIDRENTAVASKALMLMLTAINGHFKIPVAYFLTNGLTSTEQANVVNMVLRTLSEQAIVVVALVFDGAATNNSMIDVLNRNGKKSTFFYHPLTKERIHVIWDVCHMKNSSGTLLLIKKFYMILKDVRLSGDTFKCYLIFKIQIVFVWETNLQNNIQFHGKIMNVRLAAQTLSRSVADALDSLRETHPAFKGCGPTVEFIRVFDRLFDICNSKSKFGKYFKQPIRPDTEKEIFDYFATATKYIEGITLHKKKIITTKSFTGFLGFIQTMRSIRHIYDENVRNGTMEYLLTCKLSQDHIETFFGCIRSRGGFNNNPNAIQLCSAYKQLMIHNEIKTPSQSNCISDNTSILTISSARSKILHYADDDGDSSILSADYKGMIVSHGLNEIVSESVVYIAGFVERSIRRKLNCQSCLEALNCREKASGTLLKKKDYGQFGGLCHPILEVVVLCRIAEKNLQTVENEQRLNEAQMYMRVVNKCLQDVPPKLLDNMDDHIKDCAPLENHRYFLIKSIIEEYLRVKLFYIGKLQTSELHKKFVRAKNTKVTLFEGQ